MLGILLLIVIGRHFYRLAEKYDKNKWLFGFIGITSYYVGTFAVGILLGLADEIFSLNINFDNNYGLGIVAMPFGIGLAYVLHHILKYNFKEQHQRKMVAEANKIKVIEPTFEEE